MLKRFTAFLSILALCTVMTGCGKPEGKQVDKKDQGEAAPVEGGPTDNADSGTN